MAAHKKRPSGGAVMTATGKKPMQLWFDESDLELVRRAAESERMHATQLTIRAVVALAKKILAKSADSA